ncbi:MAG TPA: hypothetical protein VFH70_07715 [Acidimicrobiales bacterium]|nr:hypothetical protein [Acidimicrobiales bacterium]
MSARDELATAATATGLVNIGPHYRQTLRPGEGFVRWAQRVRPGNGLGWIDTWEVWVALSQDNETAERWLDTNLAAVVAAVETEATVTGVSANVLGLGGSNNTNGIIITAARGSAD